MDYPHQVDKQTLLIASGSYGRCASAVDGYITDIKYKSDTPAVGDCTFDVLHEGSSIYTNPVDKPVMLDGTQSISIVLSDLGISVPVAAMDGLEFAVALSSGGAVGNALYTQLNVRSSSNTDGAIIFDDGGADTDGFFIFDEGTV